MSLGPTPLGRPPRPVPDAPRVEPEAVAKGWLLELVAAAPLQSSAKLPVAELATEGPDFCGALLAAVRGHDELDLLTTSGAALRAGSLAGAMEPAAVIAAVEALRKAAWRELMAASPGATDPGLLVDLADRLAHVCSVVAALAVGQQDPASLPGAVLVLEVDGLEQLEAAEPDGPLGADLQLAEYELRSTIRPEDSLTRERAGRWRVAAPGADAAAARELAERLSRAFAACAPVRHGVRLTLSIGIAVSPDDAGVAEAGLFAARAAGVAVV